MNQRLEMFCDGVFAIAITLLILEIKIPPLESAHSVSDVWHSIGHLWPSFFALLLSFVIILISWIGHHNLLKMIDKSSSQFLVANGFFLFTVIILPFPTSFMAEYLDSPYAQPSIVVYCTAACLHNIGWNILYLSILKPKPLMKDSIGVNQIKNYSKGSRYGFLLYLTLALLSWWLPYVAIVLSVLTWAYWLSLSIAVKEKK